MKILYIFWDKKRPKRSFRNCRNKELMAIWDKDKNTLILWWWDFPFKKRQNQNNNNQKKNHKKYCLLNLTLSHNYFKKFKGDSPCLKNNKKLQLSKNIQLRLQFSHQWNSSKDPKPLFQDLYLELYGKNSSDLDNFYL